MNINVCCVEAYLNNAFDGKERLALAAEEPQDQGLNVAPILLVLLSRSPYLGKEGHWPPFWLRTFSPGKSGDNPAIAADPRVP